jgi:hypothetical protein
VKTPILRVGHLCRLSSGPRLQTVEKVLVFSQKWISFREVQKHSKIHFYQ